MAAARVTNEQLMAVSALYEVCAPSWAPSCSPSFSTTAPVPTLPRPAGGLSPWAAGRPQGEDWAPCCDQAQTAVLDEPDGLVEPASRLALAALAFATTSAVSPATTDPPPLRFVGLGGLTDVCRCRLRRARAPATGVSTRLAFGTQAAPAAVTATPDAAAGNTYAYVLANPLAAMLHRLHGCADVVLVLATTSAGPRLHYARSVPALAVAGLTTREADVLAHLLARRRDAEIAAALTIGETTVRSHCRAVYRKLSVANRAQLRAVFGA